MRDREIEAHLQAWPVLREAARSPGTVLSSGWSIDPFPAFTERERMAREAPHLFGGGHNPELLG